MPRTFKKKNLNTESEAVTPTTPHKSTDNTLNFRNSGKPSDVVETRREKFAELIKEL